VKLYSAPLSGHSHRARLFLSLIGVAFETVDIDLAKRQQKTPEYLAINPFGQVPALDDDGFVVTDSNAILVYLAKKFDRHDWLPEDAGNSARIQKWLSVAAGEIARGPAAARLITVFKAPLPAEETINRAHAVLSLIEAELGRSAFIVGKAPTIADVALYSYVSSAPEGNVDLSSYPRIKGWLASIEALPGFIPFQKTKIGLAA
jgi:glutathione S-transferase